MAKKRRRNYQRKTKNELSAGTITKAMKFYGFDELGLRTTPVDNTVVPVENGDLVNEVQTSQQIESMPKKSVDKTKPTTAGNNNNDTDLSDQNNSVSCSKNTNGTGKGCNTNTRQNKNMAETIPNPADPNLARCSTKSKCNNDTMKGKKYKHKHKITLKQMLEHEFLNKKPKFKQYECDHCKITFCAKASLRRHMLVHLNVKPYFCPHCPDKKYRARGNWRAHMAQKHPKEFEKMKFCCRKCKKPFQLKEHLKLHQKAHTNARYNCVFCDKVFKTQVLLTQHEKLHMVPGRYKCSMCSMSYDSRTLYSNHLKTHAKLKNYSCQYCGKAYLRPSSIARHIRVGHGGMRMQCPICYKLLRGHLTEHMRTHENQRPHACDICGQKFTQSTQLTVHKRSHSGARPYTCRICDQPFSHSNALMLHIRRHTGEKPFECAMCPQSFSQLPHMKTHMRSIHSKTEFYKCNNCSKFFKLKASLVSHSEECRDPGESEKKEKPSKKENSSALVTRMRFLLALLFTMIASKEKLYDLGFNKRLIDDILVDSVEAMGLQPCKDRSLNPLSRLKINVLMLLQGTVPKQQMALFVKEKKTTEELLELLTDEKEKKK